MIQIKSISFSLSFSHTHTHTHNRYGQQLAVEAVEPRLGVHTGGTILTLVVSNLHENDRVYCKFNNDVVVNGVNLGSNLAKCMSPSWSSQHEIVNVSVSNNNVDFVFAETFLYHDTIVLNTIQPRSGSTGTSIQLSLQDDASFLQFSRKLYCKFGNLLVTSEQLSSSSISCTAPQHSDNTDVVMSFSLNGQQYYGNNTIFTYREPAKVYEIIPSSASRTGGSIVEIRGENFFQDVSCTFFFVLFHYSSSNSLSHTQTQTHILHRYIRLKRNSRNCSRSCVLISLEMCSSDAFRNGGD